MARKLGQVKWLQKMKQNLAVFNPITNLFTHHFSKLKSNFARNIFSKQQNHKKTQSVHPIATTARIPNPSRVPKFLGIKYDLIFLTAEKCFNALIHLSSGLCLVGFKQKKCGQYVSCSQRERWIRYGILALPYVSMTHKFVVTAERLFLGKLDVTTFMCITTCLTFFGPWCFSLAVTFKTSETVDTLNAWPMILSSVQGDRRGRGRKRKAQFQNLSLALKVITLTTIMAMIALIMPMISIVFKDMPVCLLSLAKNVGIVQAGDGILPHVAWQLLFVPAELALVVPLLAAAGMGAGITIIGLGVFKIYMDLIR